MGTTFKKSDARGSLEVEELRPGHLWVRVQGYLTRSVGGEFPSLAHLAAAHADHVHVFIDARALKGYDAALVDAWRDEVLADGAHVASITIGTRGVPFTIAARSAALFFKPHGVPLDVVTNELEFETRLVRARRDTLFPHAA